MSLEAQIAKKISDIIDAHHFTWMMEDPDNKGPKGGKLFIYVCSCGSGFADRKLLAEHQKRALMGQPEVEGSET